MCKQSEQIRTEYAHYQATGELPAAWAPAVNDAELDEINRDPELDAHMAELDAIESGSVEPPVGGWITTLRARSGEFPVDRADGMDDAAVRILVANMAAGRNR